MSRVVRVGVVGCGEVAQIVHLPALRGLPDLFEVVALCDVSAAVLDKVGAQWPSAKRYKDHRDLVADADVDAVLVSNPHVYHAEVAIDAMRAGKHALIEKPMCVNLDEADALLDSNPRRASWRRSASCAVTRPLSSRPSSACPPCARRSSSRGCTT